MPFTQKTPQKANKTQENPLGRALKQTKKCYQLHCSNFTALVVTLA